MIRPFGKPPIPSAISNPSEPVEIACTSTTDSRWPSFITEPLPNAFSIWPIAASSALFLSSLFIFKSTISADMLSLHHALSFSTV